MKIKITLVLFACFPYRGYQPIISTILDTVDSQYSQNAIVSCEWLNENLNSPYIRIYDCTTYLHYKDEDPSLPYIVESGKEKYETGHIPNSSFLDLQLQFCRRNF